MFNAIYRIVLSREPRAAPHKRSLSSHSSNAAHDAAHGSLHDSGGSLLDAHGSLHDAHGSRYRCEAHTRPPMDPPPHANSSSSQSHRPRVSHCVHDRWRLEMGRCVAVRRHIVGSQLLPSTDLDRECQIGRETHHSSGLALCEAPANEARANTIDMAGFMGFAGLTRAFVGERFPVTRWSTLVRWRGWWLPERRVEVWWGSA